MLGWQPSHWSRKAGLVELTHGRLEDPAHHQWLTEKRNCVFVNNFADVFGTRSDPKKATNQKRAITVDSRIAAMFAKMLPGSVMVTLHPIGDLGLTRENVLEHRSKHKLKTPVPSNASFFSMEKIELGMARDTVSWSENGGCNRTIWIYKYTRLKQSSQEAVFLCTNQRHCDRARNATPVRATANGENGLIMKCCDCKVEAIKTRSTRAVCYKE